MNLLRVTALHAVVIGPLDLVVNPGEIVCISGRSGSGKTVLLRAIADLDPNRGEVWLHGCPRASYPPAEWRRRVSLLPAEPQWWAERVGEHFPNDEIPLAAFGLHSGILARSVSRASTGERQRLALARLLAHRPEVLLLDEPTASLDPDSVQRVERVLTDYRRHESAAILWVSHDPAQIARVADRHLVLEQGRLVERPL